MKTRFEMDLATLINRHSQERESNTPDFILADYIDRCLDAFHLAIRNRDEWYGVDLKPGETTRNISQLDSDKSVSSTNEKCIDCDEPYSKHHLCPDERTQDDNEKKE